MALNADTLLDRIYLKNQARRWRLLAFIALLLAALALFAKINSGAMGGNYIARYKVEGIITDDDKQHKLLMDIAKDRNAKALIVEIDSPGGTTVGGEQLYLDLREVAQHKPVVATMRTIAASAAYMTAIAADRVFAREGTLTGSIGVIVETAEVTELAKKIGITPITVKSGELKASPTPFEPLTAKGQAMLQDVVQSFFDYFVNLVKERRKLTPDEVSQILSGRIYSGRQALGLHLIDAIGSEDDAIDWLEKERKLPAGLEVKEKKVEEEESGLLNRLTGSIASGINLTNLLGKPRPGLVSQWGLPQTNR